HVDRDQGSGGCSTVLLGALARDTEAYLDHISGYRRECVARLGAVSWVSTGPRALNRGSPLQHAVRAPVRRVSPPRLRWMGGQAVPAALCARQLTEGA